MWLPEAENRGEQNGLKEANKHKFAILKYISHGDIVYNMVTIVDNTILHSCKS